MAQLDGIDIPDNLLESVSGGALDEVSIGNLKSLVNLLKQSGKSLEETCAALSYLQTTDDWDETNRLIGEFYNAA